jgi:hypothetical protein
MADNESTPADTYEEGYDRAIMICQQLQEQLDRALLQVSTISAALTLPSPVALNLLGWNASATALVNYAPASTALPAPTVADIGKVPTVDGTGAGYVLAASGGGTSISRSYFTNANLVAGVLTVTHSKALIAPYGVIAFVFDNTGKRVTEAVLTGLTNTFTVNLSDFGTIAGTWEIVYFA